MTSEYNPKTFRIFIESISENFLHFPHLLAFIETGSDSASVMMTVNEVSEAHKIDFEMAMGGTRKDDGRRGVLVYMRWHEIPDMKSAVTFTVWQKGVAKYSQAEPLPDKLLDPNNPTNMIEHGPLD